MLLWFHFLMFILRLLAFSGAFLSPEDPNLEWSSISSISDIYGRVQLEFGTEARECVQTMLKLLFSHTTLARKACQNQASAARLRSQSNSINIHSFEPHADGFHGRKAYAQNDEQGQDGLMETNDTARVLRLHRQSQYASKLAWHLRLQCQPGIEVSTPAHLSQYAGHAFKPVRWPCI
jgi:hypothetical protein